MNANFKRAILCAACIWSVTPAFAAQKDQKEMPEGRRDEKAMTYTEKKIENHQKDNKEANSNVDSLIKNRK